MTEKKLVAFIALGIICVAFVAIMIGFGPTIWSGATLLITVLALLYVAFAKDKGQDKKAKVSPPEAGKEQQDEQPDDNSPADDTAPAENKDNAENKENETQANESGK